MQIGLDQLIQAAIEQAKLLKLRYRGKDRIVEPHGFGSDTFGVGLLAYQVAGLSSAPLPNWRWMEADLISDARLVDQTSPGEAAPLFCKPSYRPRPVPAEGHAISPN